MKSNLPENWDIYCQVVPPTKNNLLEIVYENFQNYGIIGNASCKKKMVDVNSCDISLRENFMDHEIFFKDDWNFYHEIFPIHGNF